MSNATKIVIATLERHYSPPIPARTAGTENLSYRLLVKDYLQALDGFSEAALEAGMRKLVAEWKYSRWPKIGELVAVVREVEEAESGRRVLQGNGKFRYGEDYWAAVKARHKAFMQGYTVGTLYQQADAEGWAWHLYLHVRKIAWLQAQIVVKCERKGVSVAAPRKEKPGDNGYTIAERREFSFDDMERDQDISVSLPSDVMIDLKARVTTQAGIDNRGGMQSIGAVAERALPAVSG